MTNLERCPFCGGKPELIESDTAAINDCWLVRCTWCQVKTVSYYDKVTPQLIWNRRTLPLAPHNCQREGHDD